MDAVVPVAGRGTRLRPLAEDKPKCLVKLNGKTILEYLLERMKKSVSTAYLIVRDKDSKIKEKIGKVKYDMDIQCIVQENQLGVAHAVLQAKDEIDDHFLLAMGDNYFSDDFDSFIDKWKKSDAGGAILVKNVSKFNNKGTGVWVDDNRVTSIQKYYSETPDLIGCGLIILPPEIFQAIGKVNKGKNDEFETETAISLLINRDFIFKPIKMKGWRRNINTKEDLEETRLRIKR